MARLTRGSLSGTQLYVYFELKDWEDRDSCLFSEELIRVLLILFNSFLQLTHYFELN